MKRLIVVLALSACAQSGCVAAQAPSAPPPPAEASLSDGATKIVTALRLRPDIDRICTGGDAFHDAMRETVINLVMSGEIGGNPRKDAESAADFVEAHCGQPQATPAGAAAPTVSSAAR